MTRNLSKNTATEAQQLRALIRKALPPLLQKLYEMALAGDTTAAKILMDRALPALSPIKEPAAFSGDTHKAMALDIVSKVAAGQIEARDALVLLEVLSAAPREEKDDSRLKGAGISAETAMLIRREILGITD
ncbi:MAG: hypothetical protein AB1717_06000 [Pseudomonadota bacterium]